MHKSVMEFCKRHITDAKGKRVLEVGAYDVNGTVRPFVESQEPEIYIGIDLKSCNHKGHKNDHRCADIVLPAEKLTEVFAKESFDIVICTEVLEHVESWQNVIDNMVAVLKTGGYIIITTRSPGFPFHEYPIDRWRFTKDNFKDIFSDFWLNELEDDFEQAGVFLKTTKRKNYHLINLHVDVEKVEQP